MGRWGGVGVADPATMIEQEESGVDLQTRRSRAPAPSNRRSYLFFEVLFNLRDQSPFSFLRIQTFICERFFVLQSRKGRLLESS